MPLIHVNLPEGALDCESKSRMIKGLTDTVLRIEGAPDTPEARSIAWLFVHEFKKDNCAVGG